jgi:hypothetical protein
VKEVLRRFLRLSALFLILSLVFFLVLGSFSDTADGRLYVFKFGIKDIDGKEISNAKISVKHWVEDRYVTGLAFVVEENGDAYSISYGYHRLRPAYSFSPIWPSAFSLSIEKDGFKKRDAKFTIKELEDKYLEEASEDEMVFRLPDFVLEKEEAAAVAEDN